MDTKLCRKCGAEKPCADFYPRQCYECKECTKARVKAREKSLTLKSLNNYGDMADRKLSYTASNAIRDGKLIRSPVCTAPGCFSTENIEAHHPDFCKPLSVVWLCRKCHYKLHKEYRRMKHAKD